MANTFTSFCFGKLCCDIMVSVVCVLYRGHYGMNTIRIKQNSLLIKSMLV